MTEPRDYPQRKSNDANWKELDVEEMAVLDAELIKGKIRTQWKGDRPAITVLTSVAITAALFSGYPAVLIPVLFFGGIGAIVWTGKKANEYKRKSPNQLGREPPSEGPD